MDKEGMGCVCVCVHVHVHTHTHIYTHNGILLRHKKKKNNEILSFTAPWVDLEGIMLSEVSLTEEDKY